jgi:hypothetical protein
MEVPKKWLVGIAALQGIMFLFLMLMFARMADQHALLERTHLEASNSDYHARKILNSGVDCS